MRLARSTSGARCQFALAAQELQLHAHRPQRRAADRRRRGASPDPCACRAPASAPRLATQLAKLVDVCAAVGVVVGKLPPRRDAAAQALRACGESPPGCRCRRTPRPAVRASSSSGCAAPAESTSAAGRCSTSHHTAVRSKLQRTAADRVARRGVDHVGPAEHDRPAARRNPATGSRSVPRGSRRSKPNGSRRVEQHDVEIARQPPMLKAVVEQQHLRRQLLDGDRAPTRRDRDSASAARRAAPVPAPAPRRSAAPARPRSRG